MASLADRFRIAAKAMVGVFSDDAAKQAFGLLQGIWPGAAGAPPSRGARERVAAYADMPWLHAVVDKVASAFAAVDWQLKVVKPAGAPRAIRAKMIQSAGPRHRRALLAKAAGDVLDITEHPLLDLLRNGNSYMTGLAVRKVTEIHRYLEGDAFWVKDRNGLGVPTAIWPIPPNWIMWTPTPSRRTFRVSFRGWQGEIPDTEVLWFCENDPSNPYARGTGLARALADELETDEYAARFCHDAATECLTRRGWVRGLDVRNDDDIATWNQDLEVLEWQRPLGITQADYRGPLHHWRGAFVDAMVTPTHRLWVHAGSGRGRGRPHPAWRFAESRELAEKPMAQLRWRDAGSYRGTQKTLAIPAVARSTKAHPWSRGGGRPPLFGVGDPRTFDVVAFAPFLGYYVAEGSPDKCAATLCQSAGGYVGEIREALRVFPAEWVRERSSAPPAVRRDRHDAVQVRHKWWVRHKGLAEWLRAQVGEGAERKRLPAEVFEWVPDAQQALIIAMVNGDGTWRDDRTAATYASVSRGLVDDVQRLCVQLGWSSHLHTPVALPSGRTCYAIGFTLSRAGRVTRHRRSPTDPTGVRRVPRGAGRVHAMPYDGKVWCVTVPNERFFTRRNGCVMLGGNTRQTFFNQARPDFVVYPKPPATWSEPERLRLQHDWGQQHEGFWRAFKARFASRELGIFEFKETNMRSLQMVQLREFERDTIVQVTGIPPEMLGILTHSNRATIESADLLFTRWVLAPRLESFRALLQERLVPEFDERLIIDYAPAIEEDREFMKWMAQYAPWSGSVDEWRALQDRDPLPDGAGEVYPLPSTLTFGQLGGVPGGETPPPESPLEPSPGQAAYAGMDLRGLATDELLALRRLAQRRTR